MSSVIPNTDNQEVAMMAVAANAVLDNANRVDLRKFVKAYDIIRDIITQTKSVSEVQETLADFEAGK